MNVCSVISKTTDETTTGRSAESLQTSISLGFLSQSLLRRSTKKAGSLGPPHPYFFLRCHASESAAFCTPACSSLPTTLCTTAWCRVKQGSTSESAGWSLFWRCCCLLCNPIKTSHLSQFLWHSAAITDQHCTTFLCWNLPAPLKRIQTNRPRSFNQKPDSSSVCITARLLPFRLPTRALHPSQSPQLPSAGTTHWSISSLSSEQNQFLYDPSLLTLHICNRLDLLRRSGCPAGFWSGQTSIYRVLDWKPRGSEHQLDTHESIWQFHDYLSTEQYQY